MRNWNVTATERSADLPCDTHLPGPSVSFNRGVDIEASQPEVFRWLCQLKVAPYSYDWIDNGRRRSPRHLTPGAELLAVGQNFMVARITEFEYDRHITGVIRDPYERIYGPLAATYLVKPGNIAASRLVVRLRTSAATPWARVRSAAFGMGDLIMMRKQLRTLKELAERNACDVSS